LDRRRSTQREQVRDFAFCGFGLLAMRERFERIAGMLPAGRRQKIEDSLRRQGRLSQRELADSLRLLRESTAEAELQQAALFAGVRAEDLPPTLRRWFCARVQELHGREDHQSQAGGGRRDGGRA
jgi:hypothetical protein